MSHPFRNRTRLDPDVLRESPRTVSDVMTHTVVAVGRAARFKEIVRTMEEWKVSALPVLEGEGRVVGVVSEEDLLSKEQFRDKEPTRLEQMRLLDAMAKAGGDSAEELMTAPAVTVRTDATLPEAARIMARSTSNAFPWWMPRACWPGWSAAATCSRCSCGPTRTSPTRSGTRSSPASSPPVPRMSG